VHKVREGWNVEEGRRWWLRCKLIVQPRKLM
jgi:hypothetical protein